MDELIKQLEAATGPNHSIDVAIAEATGWFHAHPNEHRAPNFTFSIDAAMTLVPEGWAWRVMHNGPYANGNPSKPRAELAEPIETKFGPGVGIRAQVDGATPAIAICIAVLKARAATAAQDAALNQLDA